MRSLLVVMAGLWGCTSQPSARLERISPTVVNGQVQTTLRLTGLFPPAVTVDLDHPARSTSSTQYRVVLVGAQERLLEATWLDEARLDAVLEAGTAPGVYSVVLTDPLGQTSSLVDGLDVVDWDGGLDAGCEVTNEDLDGDGWGACGDCNDADPLTHPGAPEICNRLDDNCNGLVDEGACPPDAGWIARTDTGGQNDDWVTASSYAPGAVWIAGRDHVLNRPGDGAFESHSQQCPQWSRASWASSDGQVMLGSGNGGHGGLAVDSPALSGCSGFWSVSDPVVGVVGFPLADGGATVVAASRHGLLWQVIPGEAPVELGGDLPSGVHLEDLHGASLDALVAVGSSEGDRPFAYLWADGGWKEEALPGSGAAHGVWALSSTSAFAVGDHGLAAERRDAQWLLLAGLDGGSLRSARAFGPGRLYTVDEEGRIRRWDGRRWETLLDLGPMSPLYDITGTSEEDLWVVGSNGLVLHWPW